MKKKILNFILMFIILGIIILGAILIRRVLIINKLSNLGENTNNKYKNNYSVKILSQSIEFDNFLEGKRICKDGEQIISLINIRKTSGEVTKSNIYNLKDKNITTLESESSKIYYNDKQREISDLNVYKGDLKDIFDINIDIDKSKLGDVEVYIIRDKESEYYINSENGLILKTVDLLNNSTHEYEYTLGEVRTEDMELPDLSEYKLQE